MTVTIWKGITIENTYTSDIIAAFRTDNRYYFKNDTTGEESKIYTMIFDRCLNDYTWYFDLQVKKYSARKKKFIKGSSK